MRLTSLLSYSLPSLLLLAAACGDSGPADANFSQASELERQRAILAGSGVDAAMAMLIGSFATAADPTSQCPRVAQSGDTFTATYNCTNDDGDRIDGRVIATNLPSLLGGGNDPTRDAVVEFEGYRIHSQDAGTGFAFDGVVTLKPDQRMIVALTAELNGMRAATDATFRPSGELTAAEDGSAVEVDGVGRATVHGAWNMSSDTPAGYLELHGAENLRVDFDAMSNGCVPVTIDGAAAGELCQGSGE